MNKFKNFKQVDRIKRFRGIFPTRLTKIRLDANERISEFDSNFITKFKKKIQSQHFTAYPEIEEIYDLLAKFNKVKRDNIMITAGSDIGIRHCFELFTQPKSKILTLNPTFGMYDVYSKIFKTNQIKIGYDKNLKLNFNKLIKSINSKTSLIMLANPNSPTGTIIPDKDIIPGAETLSPAYIIFENYEKILNWNRSLRFALAVCTLKESFKNEI